MIELFCKGILRSKYIKFLIFTIILTVHSLFKEEKTSLSLITCHCLLQLVAFNGIVFIEKIILIHVGRHWVFYIILICKKSNLF